jgi:Ca2+-binding EF-hand superfamily protein
VAEFLDKLKEVHALSEKTIERCKQLFAKADSDGSGFLDEAEVAYVAEEMGLSDKVCDPLFVKTMINEMESLYSQHLEDSELADHSGTGENQVHFHRSYANCTKSICVDL